MPVRSLAILPVLALLSAGTGQAHSTADTADERKGLSPTEAPYCANPVPPPMTVEQLESYRSPRAVRSPRPALGPADRAAPLRAGALPKHECFLKVAERGEIDLLFIGDSITDFFGRPDRGQPVWNQHYGTLRAANFGISGDTTQDVLWRIENGELEGFSAKAIVLMIGTNNIGRNTVDEIAAGNAAIVREIRQRQPGARILLLGIFPRGNSANNPARKTIAAINEQLARLDDGKSVFYRDIGPVFLASDGTMRDAMFVDGTHPGIFGYAAWADAIQHELDDLLAGNAPTPRPDISQSGE